MKTRMKKLIFSFLGAFVLCASFAMPVYAFLPTSTPLYNGIDVSEWQGTIDFSAVKASGQEIVYIRASVGDDYTDSCLDQNYQGAQAAGMKIGFYHYLMAKDVAGAQAEADYFASVIQGMQADCLLAMDYESFDGLSNEEINAISLVFLQTVQSATGQNIMIYSDAYNAGTVFGESLAGYPLWVADYDVQQPYGNDVWNYWVAFQYTDSGSINGINGNVDLDYFTSQVFTQTSTGGNTGSTSHQNATYVTVEWGDTLSEIALAYSVTVDELVQWNQISNPDLIYVGQILVIYTTAQSSSQASQSYTVESGDTLWGLAQYYGTTVDAILAINPQISNSNLIYIGETILIP